MLRFPVFIFIISVFASMCGAQGSLESRVNEDIKQIRTTPGGFDVLFWELPPSAVSDLFNLGMDAVPSLLPFLSDQSATELLAHRSHNLKYHALPVSYFARAIVGKITQHEFVPPKDDDQDSVEAYKRDILSWWERNHSKTLLERKLEEVNDPIHTNRFSAYRWLGSNKVKEARLLIECRISELLKGDVDSLTQEEFAECANSLAEIGDRRSLSEVEKVCDHLSYWIYMTYRSSTEGRSAPDSGQLSPLFMAFGSMAKLGEREKAVTALVQIREKYLSQMEPSTQSEFLKGFEEATY
jgi:hypothetical protein